MTHAFSKSAQFQQPFCSKIVSPEMKFDQTPSSRFFRVFISFASSCAIVVDVGAAVAGSEWSGFYKYAVQRNS